MACSLPPEPTTKSFIESTPINDGTGAYRVNAITMPYLLQRSMQTSSLMDPPGSANIANAASVRSFNVIVKREESVGAERYSLDGVEILPCLSVGERLGLGCKVLLPNAVCAYVLFVLVDVAVDNVVSVRSAYCGLKWQVEHLVVLAQEPCVRLAACQTCAVDS